MPDLGMSALDAPVDLSVDDDPSTDARPDRDHHDDATPLSRAQPHFPHRCCICVVLQDDPHTVLGLQWFDDVHPVPGRQGVGVVDGPPDRVYRPGTADADRCQRTA